MGNKACDNPSRISGTPFNAIPFHQAGVHIWAFSLVRAPEDLRGLSEVLNSDERRRAAAFHFPKDREKFIAARGSLRMILGEYLDQDPRDLRFSYGPNGKPEIGGEAPGSYFRFNLSHSHEMAVLAVARGRRVGIDLETTRGDRLDPVEIAEACFAPAEQRLIRGASGEERIDLFYRIWTRKEAVLKGLGIGLGGLLDQFQVSLGLLQAISAGSGVQSDSVWSVEEFRIHPNYVGAIAVEGDRAEISFCGTVDGKIPLRLA